MAWKNISRHTLVLPSGKTVANADTFTKKQAAGLNVRALERGKAIEWTGTGKKNRYV